MYWYTGKHGIQKHRYRRRGSAEYYDGSFVFEKNIAFRDTS